MADADRHGHIELDGKRYIIDLPAYKGRDVIDFSPRASTPGGGIVMSTLGFYQPLMMSTWTSGFGFPWHTDEGGYLRTEGEVDCRHRGLAMRFTTKIESDTTISQVNKFLEFKGDVYAGMTSKGVRKFNGTVWADVSDSAKTINDLWHNGKYLFLCEDDGRIRYADSSVADSDGWTAAGLNDSSKDYSWLHHHDGFAYAGKDQNDSGEYGNQVYYDDDIALADLHGNVTDDVNVIYVGMEGEQVGKPVSYQGKMLFPRADGLYVLSDDKQTAKVMLDYKDQSDSDNFLGLTEWNGYLVYNIKDQLKRWNGTSEVNITPPRVTDVWPYITYGRFRHLTQIGDWLYCVARTNNATYEEHLLVYDGAGWQKLAELITDGTGTISAMQFDAFNNYLWYHNTTDGTTNYIRFQDQSVFPYPHFAEGIGNYLYTSRIDAGFQMVDKSSPSMLIGATNCDDSSYLTVEYQKDAETTWYPWGGDTAFADFKVKDNGWTVLDKPTGHASSTLEYKHLKLRVGFVTSDTTKSPVLESMVLRLLMRPETLYGFSLPLVITEESEYGVSMGVRSTAEQMRDLKAARSSVAPVKYVDPRGDEYVGYLTSINEQFVEQHAHSLGDPNIEERVFVNFVEVG